MQTERVQREPKDLVQLLLDHGADPTQTDHFQYTPLTLLALLEKYIKEKPDSWPYIDKIERGKEIQQVRAVLLAGIEKNTSTGIPSNLQRKTVKAKRTVSKNS